MAFSIPMRKLKPVSKSPKACNYCKVVKTSEEFAKDHLGRLKGACRKCVSASDIKRRKIASDKKKEIEDKLMRSYFADLHSKKEVSE
jgi:hypothetical protein